MPSQSVKLSSRRPPKARKASFAVVAATVACATPFSSALTSCRTVLRAAVAAG